MRKSEVADVYQAIKNEIDREFNSCDRRDRSGGYRVKANNVFMLVDPLPRKGVVDVKLHLRPGEGLPHHDLLVGRESMRGRNTVTHLHINSLEQIPRVMELACYVHRKTGMSR